MKCSRLYVRDAGTILEIRENFMPRKFPPIRYKLKGLDGGATKVDGGASAPVGPSVATQPREESIEMMV